MTDMEYMISELRKRLANLDFEADSKHAAISAVRTSLFELDDEMKDISRKMNCLQTVIQMLEDKWKIGLNKN